MGAESTFLPDWRDAAAYAPLLGADRSLFAWEWLRRNPAYRAAAAAAFKCTGGRSGRFSGAEAFGLVAFEPPELAVPRARPLWSSKAHPPVLKAAASRMPGGREDQFDLDRFRAIARLHIASSSEHLLLSDGLRSIRLDGAPGSFTSGPARLHYSLSGLVSIERPLLTLRRLLALSRSGHFSSILHAREARARRWIRVLRAWDALAGGAAQRDIAEMLLSTSAGEPCWRSREASIRSQAQRLARSARQASGHWRWLLD